MKTEADSPNWYPLHTLKKCLLLSYVILCCCLTHFSENCVKMKPKYRLPTQRPDWLTLGCDGAELRSSGWHLIITVDLLFIRTALALSGRPLICVVACQEPDCKHLSFLRHEIGNKYSSDANENTWRATWLHIFSLPIYKEKTILKTFFILRATYRVKAVGFIFSYLP